MRRRCCRLFSEMGDLAVIARCRPLRYRVGFERRFGVVGLVSGLPLEHSPEPTDLCSFAYLTWAGGRTWEGWA